MSPFQRVKFWLVNHLDLAKDALHVHAGLIVFLGSAALFGWSLRSWKPWLAVLVVAVAAELWDLRDSLVYDTPIRLRANLKDIVNTLFWPTMLMMLARFTRMLKRN